MFPATTDELAVELLVNGTWTDITSDVREAGDITITRGRDATSRRVTPQQCRLWINNRAGTYSTRNPLSPYYGLLGRNTQLRVRVAEPWPTDAESGLSTASHVAPSVEAAAGLLICAWLAGSFTPGTINYTVPGGMTAGTELDGTYSTSRSAYESISAGATGTRTATASASTAWFRGLSIAVPGTVSVEEILQDVAHADDVILTTDAGTQADWWIIAIQIRSSGSASGADRIGLGSRWMPILDTGDDELGHVKAWARPVDASGAVTATFPGLPDADNHCHVYVLSGVTGLPAPAAYRFWGEVPEWPQAWDRSGRDVVAPIEANGLLRRLDRAGAPLRSALFRAATSVDAQTVLRGYWPLEDGSRASVFASGIGHAPARHTGTTPGAAAVEPFFGSAPVLQLGSTTKLRAEIPPYANTGLMVWRLLLDTASSYSDNTRVAEMLQTGGSVSRWQIRYKTGSGGQLQVRALDEDGTELENSGSIAMSFDDTQTVLSLILEQSGADVLWTLAGRSVTADATVATAGSSGTFTSQTLGRIFRMYIAPAGGMDGTAVGHWMLADGSLPLSIDDALVGHSGETASDRIARLCEEEGVPVAIIGDPGQSAAMGPQGVETLGELLHECRDADMGFLYEARHEFSLVYRPRVDLYNQTGPALSYSSGHLSILAPRDNDDFVANDVTVSRPSGSSARRFLDDGGPMSISEPEDGGIGTYPLGESKNVEVDDQLDGVAGWLLHLGTWDEIHYPQVGVNLVRPVFTASKAAAVAALELGDYFAVEDLPSWLPPGQAEVLLQGYAERLAVRSWELEWATTPAGPWFVFVVEDSVYGRLDTGGSELSGDVDDIDTTFIVETDLGKAVWINSTDRPGDFPFNIILGGELVRVTAISGTTSPQTFTVVRSVNGIPKTHTAGTRLRISKSVLGL